MTGQDKVLWKRQGVQDNHVCQKSFLSSLKRNSSFNPYAYWPLVHLSCAITQQISTTFIFLAVFVLLKQSRIDPRLLVQFSCAIFAVGYVLQQLLVYTWTSRSSIYVTHINSVKSSIVIFLALMSLSPVLRTLTAATSSDSIWALSAILLVSNAQLADYVPCIGQAQKSLSSVLSVNAAISASVVLASRLNTDIAVLALILFALQSFAFFPVLRRSLQTSIIFQAFLTLGLSMSSLFLTAWLSAKVMFLFLLILLSITFLAPALLMWAQRYKDEIRGPWDVASPRLK